MIGCIIGTGGTTIKALQKEFNIQMKTDKSDKGEKGEHDVLTIRGNASKVASAKIKILELLSSFLANTDVVQIPEELISLVVGKKGTKIKELREMYPDAVIDVESSSVKIQGPDPYSRQAIRTYLQDLVKSNYSMLTPVPSDLGISMKGARGNDLRSLMGILNLQFDIFPEAGNVKIRGVKDNVLKGMMAIEAFTLANYSLDIPCNEDDFSSLFNASNTDSSIKDIEETCNVEIRPLRKEGTVRIRGEKSAVDRAKIVFSDLLTGNSSGGSKVFSIAPQSFASIIGKGGVTLKKFEADNDVKIDLLRSQNAVRIRGVPSSVEKAKLSILKFIDDIKVSFSVDFNFFSKEEIPEIILQKAVDSAISIYQVDISIEKSVVFKGSLYLVEEAKQYVKMEIEGNSVFLLPIPNHLVDSINSIQSKIDVIKNDNKVDISIIKNIVGDDSYVNLSIVGDILSVNVAKIAIVKLLKHHLSKQFLILELPQSCLREMGPAFICEIDQISGAILTVDRLMKCVRIIGTEKSVVEANEFIENTFMGWKKHNAIIPIEIYMLPTLMGKNGSAIAALQRETQVKIHINRIAMVLELQSSSSSPPEVLQDAIILVGEKVESLRVHSWQTTVDLSMIGLLVGKQGENILR